MIKSLYYKKNYNKHACLQKIINITYLNNLGCIAIGVIPFLKMLKFIKNFIKVCLIMYQQILYKNVFIHLW